MKKPYIICHMVESVDGRIDCTMVDKISGDEYYTTLGSLDCPASVEGRVTMEHYYALPQKFPADTDGSIGKEKIYKATDRSDFHICPDTKGTLMWEQGIMDDGRPLLVITSERASRRYLGYLEEKGISYIATGKESIDLARAMCILAETFGVERLAVLGGGVINGAFLNAGLIDELSLLLAPGIDGRNGMRAVFDGIADEAKQPTKLSITTIEKFDNDVVWIKYKVVA